LRTVQATGASSASTASDRRRAGQVALQRGRLADAIGGQQGVATDACRTRRLEVGPPVAEHQRRGQVQAKAVGGAQDHAGPGLAAIAGQRVAGDHRIGQVRAVFDGRQLHALLREAGAQRVVQALQRRFVVVAARDARLVRHHDQRIACRLQPTHRIDDAGHEDEVLPAMHVAAIDVDDAVAVEERGALARHAPPARIRRTRAVVE